MKKELTFFFDINEKNVMCGTIFENNPNTLHMYFYLFLSKYYGVSVFYNTVLLPTNLNFLKTISRKCLYTARLCSLMFPRITSIEKYYIFSANLKNL